MAFELGVSSRGLAPGEVEVKPSGCHLLPSQCRPKAKPWTMEDLADSERALAMLMRLPTATEKAAFATAFRKQQAQTELQPVALCCLTRENPLRIVCERLMRSWWFDQFVVAAILVNCIVLALFDPLDTTDETWQNQIGNVLEWPFTVIFTLELVIKIIAMGLIGKRAYLADGWNWIDGSVVVVGYFGLFPGVGNVSALRTFRVLRPLRTLTRFEGMRVIVQAMLSSVPALFNVALLCAFIFLVFGIIGVQLWAGVLHGRCMYETPSGELVEHPDSLFCALSCQQFPTTCTYTFGQGCPAYEALVTNTSTGLLEREVMPGSCHSIGNPGFGGVGFDNIGLACLTIFTAITLEGWADVMYALTRAWGIEPVVTLYFILVIMFGAFFLLNLALAVVWDEYETAASERIESQRALIRHLTIELQAALPGAAELVAENLADAKGDKPPNPDVGRDVQQTADGKEDACGSEAEGTRLSKADAPNHNLPSGAGDSTPGSVVASEPPRLTGPLSAATSPSTPGVNYPRESNPGSAIVGRSVVSSGRAGSLRLPGDSEAPRGDDSGIASPTAAFHAVSGGHPKSSAALKKSKPAGRRISSRVTFVTDQPAGLAGGKPSPRQDTDTSIRMDSSTTDGSISTMGSGTSTASSIRRLPTAWQFSESDRAKMGCCQYVATSRALELTISFLIGLNTIALAIEHHGMSPVLSNVLEILNYCFTFIFATEMLIKLAGLGLQMYCRSAFNVFDAVVVCVSVVEIILSLTSAELASGLSALRTFRLMRVFKLAKTWKDLQRLLVTIMRSVLDVASASVVLLIIMFIFVLLGMQLFGGRFGESAFGDDPPRAHFDNFGWAFVTVFQVLTGENWNEVLFASKHAVGDIAVAYFVALTIVGNYLILNLFLAILLGNFEKAAVDDAKAAAKKRRRAFRKAQMAEGEGQDDASARCLESAVVEDDACIQATLSQDALEGGAQLVDSPKSAAREPADEATPKARHSQVLDVKMMYRGRMVGTSRMTTTITDETGRRLAVKITKSGDVSVKDGGASSMGSDSGEVPDEQRVRLANSPDADMPLQWPQHYTLGLFAPNNALRRFSDLVVTNPWFGRAILVLIALSSVLLAVDEPAVAKCQRIPSGSPGSCETLGTILYVADVSLTALFSFELVVKLVSMGGIGSSHAYFASGWNILDFAIVGVSIASLALGEASSLKALRSLRALRALRPLRVVSRYPSLKLVVNSIFGALPKVTNVALVNFLFFFIFAIVGVQNFTGALSQCNDPDAQQFDACVGSFNVTGSLCTMLPDADQAEACRLDPEGAPFPRLWEPPPYHFDNVLNGLLTVFEVATGEMWPDIMYVCVDSVGPGEPRKKDSQPAAAIFFVMIQVLCAFFMLEVFTGVIIDNFNKLKAESKGSGLLTPEQQRLIESLKMLLSVRPRRVMRPPKAGDYLYPVRLVAFRVAESYALEVFIMTVILVNSAFLAARFYGQPLEWETILETTSTVFTVVFSAEACVKMLGLGMSQYFVVNWNKFDFVLVIAGWVGILFDVGPLATLLRVFRVARIFRLVRTSRGLMQLLRTLIVSIPSLLNVGALLLLLFFIFACVGMNLFSDIKHGEFLNDEANFESFGTAMVTLFRVSTGESYNGIMHDAMVQPPYCDPDTNCGDLVTAPIFFVVFFIISSFVLLNLLVAIILDNFEDTKSAESTKLGFRLTEDFSRHYQDLWSKFDPLATGVVSFEDLVQLVCSLRFPLGLKDHPGVHHGPDLRHIAEKVLEQLNIQSVENEMFEFQIVLQALVNNASGRDWEQARITAAPRLQIQGDLKIMGGLRQALAVRKIQALVRSRHEFKRRLVVMEEELGRPATDEEKSKLRTQTMKTDRRTAAMMFAMGTADAAHRPQASERDAAGLE